MLVPRPEDRWSVDKVLDRLASIMHLSKRGNNNEEAMDYCHEGKPRPAYHPRDFPPLFGEGALHQRLWQGWNSQFSENHGPASTEAFSAKIVPQSLAALAEEPVGFRANSRQVGAASAATGSSVEAATISGLPRPPNNPAVADTEYPSKSAVVRLDESIPIDGSNSIQELDRHIEARQGATGKSGVPNDTSVSVLGGHPSPLLGMFQIIFRIKLQYTRRKLRRIRGD